MNWGYERAMWKGLFHCLRHGHLIVGLGKEEKNAPYYCWTCFHDYPYTAYVGVLQKVRQFLGYFARRT